MHEYLFLVVIPEPYRGEVVRIMNEIAAITELPAPHLSCPPHVSLHVPQESTDTRSWVKAGKDAAKRGRATTLHLGRLRPFGKHFIVLPVEAPLALSRLWVDLNQRVTRLPDHRPSPHEEENSLHTTVAKRTSAVFDAAWPRVLTDVQFEPMEIAVDRFELWRRIPEGRWGPHEIFELLP